jgi:hypothetical protein
MEIKERVIIYKIAISKYQKIKGIARKPKKQVQDGKLGKHVKDRKLETLECINESKES